MHWQLWEAGTFALPQRIWCFWVCCSSLADSCPCQTLGSLHDKIPIPSCTVLFDIKSPSRYRERDVPPSPPPHPIPDLSSLPPRLLNPRLPPPLADLAVASLLRNSMQDIIEEDRLRRVGLLGLEELSGWAERRPRDQRTHGEGAFPKSPSRRLGVSFVVCAELVL